MKQGKTYLKVIMAVLAFMVVSYILYNVIHALSSGVVTTQAVVFSAAEGVSTEGFLVRDETVLTASYDLVLPTRQEGEKVSAGAEVAMSFRTTQAQTRQTRIRQLKEDMAQLEQAMNLQSQLTDNVEVARRIDSAMAQFAVQVAQGRLSSAASGGESLKALVLRRELGTDDTGAMEEQYSRMQSELEELEEGAFNDTTPVTVDRAGYYSAVSDGYESLLTPETLNDMTVEAFRNLWEAGEGVNRPAHAAGRMIHSSQWYYAALVEDSRLDGIGLGDRLQVSFSGDRGEGLEMTVVRLERVGGEEGLMVLSCDRSLAEFSALRRTGATVIFHSYSGVRVPKEAVRYDAENDTAGVYILENGKAVWKSVTLIYDVGDAYITELDQSSTKHLWPGDLILTETENLYDGKVVE